MGMMEDAIAQALAAVNPQPAVSPFPADQLVTQSPPSLDQAFGGPAPGPSPVDQLTGHLGGGMLDAAVSRALAAAPQAAQQAPAQAPPPPAPQGPPAMAEPQDPYPGVAPTPQPTEQGPDLRTPTSVEDATAQEQDQLRRAADAAARQREMELAAKADQSRRLADAQTQYADAMLQHQNDYKAERAAISARADAATATWMQNMQALATREPNPSRWWNNQGGLGRALWGLGMVFGAMHAGLTPGAHNEALAMVQREIDGDMGRQSDRMKQEFAVEKMRGEQEQAKYARDSQYALDDLSGKLARLQALGRAWETRATAPGDMDAAAAKQAGIAWIEEKKMELAGKYRQTQEATAARLAEEKFQARQQQLRLGHDAYQAKLDRQFRAEEAVKARQHEMDMEDKQFGHKLALSPVEVGGSAGPSARNPLGKDGKPLYEQLASRPDESGAPQVVLTDAAGNPVKDGAVLFGDAKKFEGANATIQAADEHFAALVELRDALEDQSATQSAATMIAGVTDPRLNSAIIRLGKATARATDGSRPTDKDFSFAIQSSLGFDPNGDWLQRGKFTLGDTLKVVNRQIDEHTKRVQAQLQQFNDEAVNGKGTKVIYRPADLRPPEVQQQNAREIAGRKPVITTEGVGEPGVPVSSAKDYLARVATEQKTPSARGALLPEHDRAAVRSVLATKDLGPSSIHAKVTATLKAVEDKLAQLDSKEDRWNGGTGPTPASDAERQRLKETAAIVKAVGDDIETRASKALDRFKDRADRMGGWVSKGASIVKLSDDTLRKMAVDEGLYDAAEVEDYIAKRKSN